jgi:putative ATPase
MEDVKNGITGDIPDYLKDAHYKGAKKLGHGLTYEYPHNFENNWVKQAYLPNELKNKRYYNPGNNKNEQALKIYWDNIKKRNPK